jgi:hypothetical protein
MTAILVCACVYCSIALAGWITLFVALTHED